MCIKVGRYRNRRRKIVEVENWDIDLRYCRESKLSHSVKIKHPSSGPSSSDDTFSLMVSPVSVPSPLDNQLCHIVSPYSMIINSSQNYNIFDSSNVKDTSGQKKRKWIINSNDSVKLK